MMISTKGRYALRIMVDVAQHDGEMPVSVREIAQRQDISGKYMEQIISVLTRSGLLRRLPVPCRVFQGIQRHQQRY